MTETGFCTAENSAWRIERCRRQCEAFLTINLVCGFFIFLERRAGFWKIPSTERWRAVKCDLVDTFCPEKNIVYA